MKYLKLFENFDTNDIVEELDNWIEDNSDYISKDSLERKVSELLGDDSLTSETEVVEDTGGSKYGENWNTNVIKIKLRGKDLVKVCVSSDGRYNSGKNSLMFEDEPKDKVQMAGFGVRFYFDRSLLN